VAADSAAQSALELISSSAPNGSTDERSRAPILCRSRVSHAGPTSPLVRHSPRLSIDVHLAADASWCYPHTEGAREGRRPSIEKSRRTARNAAQDAQTCPRDVRNVSGMSGRTAGISRHFRHNRSPLGCARRPYSPPARRRVEMRENSVQHKSPDIGHTLSPAPRLRLADHSPYTLGQTRPCFWCGACASIGWSEWT
jgi:hypothetical protein